MARRAKDIRSGVIPARGQEHKPSYPLWPGSGELQHCPATLRQTASPALQPDTSLITANRDAFGIVLRPDIGNEVLDNFTRINGIRLDYMFLRIPLPFWRFSRHRFLFCRCCLGL